MHIPDGFLDAKTWVTLTAVSTAVVGVALKKKESKLEPKDIPLLGMMTTFIFAAQMINFPVAGATSGHLLGGALAAILFGPWLAAIMMTAVIGVQALIFQDGGITAIGANVFNTGIVTAFVGYGVYAFLRRVARGRMISIAVFTGACLSVVASAAFASLELALSGTVPLAVVLKAMVSWHVLIGIGEGVITAFVVKSLMSNPSFASIVTAKAGVLK